MIATESVIYTTGYNRLRSLGFANAQFLAAAMLAQAKHETGNFTSTVFLRNNNICGYKYVGSRYQLRPGVRSPESDYYGAYSKIADSAKELADWIGRRKEYFSGVEHLEAYNDALVAGGFYTDRKQNYLRGLTRYFTALPVPARVGGGLFILAAIAVYLWNSKNT